MAEFNTVTYINLKTETSKKMFPRDLKIIQRSIIQQKKPLSFSPRKIKPDSKQDKLNNVSDATEFIINRKIISTFDPNRKEKVNARKL